MKCSSFFFSLLVQIEQRKASKAPKNRFSKKWKETFFRCSARCSASFRHPAPSSRRCCAAQRVRLRGLSLRPIPGVVASSKTHLRMSNGKARAKQPRDTAEDAVLQLQALHHTHREATRLFLMAVREGATETQIADALRQGFPHVTDTASLKTVALAKSLLRALVQQRKTSSLLRRRRGRAPRVKLRRRNQLPQTPCCSFRVHSP